MTGGNRSDKQARKGGPAGAAQHGSGRPPGGAGRTKSHQLILEAASEEFARHGFAGARIETIAHRTRLNVRMIYYHFRSKEDLYLEVLHAIYRDMAHVLDGEAPSDGVEPAVVAFQRYVDLLSENPRFADILVREAVEGGKRLGRLFAAHPELYERLHLRASRLLEESMQRGLLRTVDAQLTVHALTGMVCMLVAARSAHSLFLGGRRVSLAEWKDLLLDLFLHGLRPG